MWVFLSAVFNKIASAAVTVLVAVGLVSAPLPPVLEAPIVETSQEPVEEMALDQSEKAEKPALPTAAKTEKPKADDSETKKLEEKLAQTAQLLEALKKASPPPAPTPAPTLTPPPSSAPSLPSGTFRLPNGVLVDINGNILQSVPSVTPASPPSSPSESYAVGSNVQIARSALVAIEFNPAVDCEALGLSLNDIKKCKLYRTEKNNYNWVIVD